MLLVTPRITSAFRVAAQRGYATSPTTSQSAGRRALVATLVTAGAAGGYFWNASEVRCEAKAEPAFSAAEFRSFKLEKVVPINHNTSLFRFTLPDPSSVAGMHVASCVITRYPFTKADGSQGYVVRPYTPTSLEDAQGHVDFVIKNYPEGKMSKHIHELKVGDSLDIKGPFQKWDWDHKPVANVGMIAGGTGITPMLQVIRRVFDHPKPADANTKIVLLFANQTEEDILLRQELESYAKRFPDRFKLVYALDRPPKNWQGHTGFVNKEVLQKYMPSPQEKDSVVFVCGPDGMMTSLSGDKAPDKSQGPLSGILKELGYTSDNVYKF